MPAVTLAGKLGKNWVEGLPASSQPMSEGGLEKVSLCFTKL
jgi:hypothetical protein